MGLLAWCFRFALAVLLVPVAVMSQDLAELEVDHALTVDFATPHTDWAQPYVKGATRVLFFTNGRGTAPRHIVELMQRFDIEAEAVFWARIIDSTEEQWHGGDLGEQRMLRLLEEEWDCFVLIGVEFTQMDAEVQYKLLKRVSEGAGLVLVGSEDARVLKPENRVEPAPQFLTTHRTGEPYSILRGRGIAMPEQPDIEYHEGWEVLYDYQAEGLGRAILWAAGREPDVAVTLRLDRASVAYDEGGSLTASCTGAVPAGTAELAIRLRRPDGPVVELPPRAIPPGGEVTVEIPRLPAGEYFADAWVRSVGSTLAWEYVPFTVASTRRVESVELDRTWGEIGEAIVGRVQLSGAPDAGETVRVNLLDRQRRVLMRQDFTSVASRVEFEFAVPAWLPMLVTVEAQVLQGAEEVASQYAYYNVTKRHRGKFNFLMWDTPKGTLAPYAEESLARHGVTLQLGGGNPQRICAAHDVAWVPYTTRIMAVLDEESIMQPFCWNDTAAVQRRVRETAEAYGASRQHGVFVWSLGDEVHTRGSCLSPQCAVAYRRYLEQEYGSLDALNASWGASYARWSEVGLADPSDNEEAGSLRLGNYPRWFDRQAFRSWNFVQLCQQYRQAYEAVDPQARVGFEGAGRFDSGDDIDLIVRSNTFWSPYPGTTDEVIRSIAPREFPRANWMGYQKDATPLLSKYWRMVTRGMDAVWWWRWDALGRFHGWLAPDLRPFPAVSEILADTQRMRDGLGDLLLQYDMQDDGIAILYSHPSSLAQRLDDGTTYGGYEAAHINVHRAVRELGLQFRYVTARMLRSGEFRADQCRVLLLPRAEALSQTSARAIRDFATSGGLVIADVRVGIFDSHLKPRAQGILDGLFGVERSGREPAVTVGDDAIQMQGLRVDPSVRALSGEPMHVVGGHPILITRRTGKGMVVLLNFDFSTYPNLSLPDTDEMHTRRLEEWLSGQGEEPGIRVLNEEAGRERNVEITRWTNGDVEIFSLFRQQGEESGHVTVELGASSAVYDIHKGEALGERDRFDAAILPGRARFYAVTPGGVPQVHLELSQGTVERGDVLKATLSASGTPGRLACRVRLMAEGQPLEAMNQNVIVGKEPVAVDVPIAYSDPMGTYRLQAVELFSGRVVTAEFSVR